MGQLSISQAWEEGTRFAGREFGLLYPIALLLIELPILAFYLIQPFPAVAAEPLPGQALTFQLMVDQFGGLPQFLLFMGMSLAAFVIQTYGGLAITWLALNPGAEIGQSLAAAGRRLPAALGVLLLVFLGFLLLSLPMWLLIVGASAQPSPGTGMAVLLFGLVFMILVIAIAPRLSVTTPVTAAERIGPFGILRRSWDLTKGNFWRLFGTFLLIGLVVIIVSLVLLLIFGTITRLLVGPPESNFTAAFVLELLNSLVFAAYSVFMFCFIAKIYEQLAEPEPAYA